MRSRARNGSAVSRRRRPGYAASQGCHELAWAGLLSPKVAARCRLRSKAERNRAAPGTAHPQVTPINSSRLDRRAMLRMLNKKGQEAQASILNSDGESSRQADGRCGSGGSHGTCCPASCSQSRPHGPSACRRHQARPVGGRRELCSPSEQSGLRRAEERGRLGLWGGHPSAASGRPVRRRRHAATAPAADLRTHRRGERGKRRACERRRHDHDRPARPSLRAGGRGSGVASERHSRAGGS